MANGSLEGVSDDSEVENEAEGSFLPSKKPAWVDEEDETEET